MEGLKSLFLNIYTQKIQKAPENIRFPEHLCLQSDFTADNYVRRKIMSVLLKSLIAVVQERNQPVDITLGLPDILLQSFLVHQPRSFHIS